MQTFLPYRNFTKSAKSLDLTRLNNQINETLQIMRTITGWYENSDNHGNGWPNHPVTRLWENDATELFEYGSVFLSVYENRSGNEVESRYESLLNAYLFQDNDKLSSSKPDFLNDDKLFDVYKNHLMKRDPVYYKTKFDNYNINFPKPCKYIKQNSLGGYL